MLLNNPRALLLVQKHPLNRFCHKKINDADGRKFTRRIINTLFLFFPSPSPSLPQVLSPERFYPSGLFQCELLPGVEVFVFTGIALCLCSNLMELIQKALSSEADHPELSLPPLVLSIVTAFTYGQGAFTYIRTGSEVRCHV